MTDLNWMALLAAGTSSLLIGIAKTGIPGASAPVVPLMASVLPAKVSVGVVLPMLMFADLFAAAYYRHNARWRHLARLLPWTTAGIILGYLALGTVNDQQLKPIIGGIVLFMLAVGWWHRRTQESVSIPTHWSFGATMGLLAGLTSMMANSAGSIVVIYLLAMRLPKTEFIGTMAWFFLIVNWIKVPFSVNLGLITTRSLQFDLLLFPVVAVGALAGIAILKRIPQGVFDAAAQILAAAAALHLLASPLISMMG